MVERADSSPNIANYSTSARLYGMFGTAGGRFHALLSYHKLRRQMVGEKDAQKLIYTSLGDWITRQRAESASGIDGADARFTAAEIAVRTGEDSEGGYSPFDIFVRWKPLHEQPIGWEPDLNDGIRVNIRPWLMTNVARRVAEEDYLRSANNAQILLREDRGKEPARDNDGLPLVRGLR